MSSTLSKYCALKDLQALKQILIPDYLSVQERNRDDDYDNRWNWQTSQLLDTSEDSSELMSALTASLMAISPTSDLLAFAKSRYLALYRLKPLAENREKGPEECAALCGELQLSLESQLVTGHKADEVITSVLLVPIVSQQKSSFAFHDWTAIVVGFSTGYLKIYTENGKLVLSRLLHNEAIIDIKCQTFRANSSSNDCDQMLILYKTSVVLIDGLSLCQTLRFCRSQLARTQSSFGSLSLNSLAADESINFTYRKWKFEDSEDIRDCHHISFQTRTELDNLIAQSLVKGPYGQPRLSAPAAHVFITCGENPYVGFYRAHEESGPILNELTQAMVNKVKNMIPFGGLFGGQNKDSQTPKIESATPIPLRMALWDQRLGLKISLSPNKRLAAVIDDFGRVTLIDTNNWLAVRMWKGYREAQVGWVEVCEETTNGQVPKRATFIIIYAPKRGILEVWVTQMGPRVGAFNVGKNCRLIQCPHSMMGLNSVLIKQFKDSADLGRSRCFLFDFNSGDFHEINIPFLCAMTDRNSKEIRDSHLLKELQQLLQKERTGGQAVDKAVQLVSMLKTSDVRREALKEVCQHSDIETIKAVTNRLKEELLSAVEKNELDFENKLIAQMCARILQLCDLYEKISSIEVSNTYITDSSVPPDIQSLIEELNWTGSDIARVLSYIAFRDALKSSSDTSSNQTVFTINEMLSQFSLHSNHIHKVDDKEVYTDIPIEANADLTANKTLVNRFLSLSNFLFNPFLQSNNSSLELLLKSSGIMASNLMILAFMSWLSSKYCNHWKCWQYFSKTLDTLMVLINNDKTKSSDIEDEDDLLSDDWNEILELIYSSDNIMAALVSVHMIKAINTKLKQKTEDLKQVAESPDMEWETLHIDNESLNLVAKQLEDLFLLDMLLHSNIDDNHPLPEVVEDIRISLSYLLQSGPGIVSELVAKWVINANVRPEMLNSIIGEPMDTTEGQVDDIAVGVEALEFKAVDLKTSSELLEHVRRCFPNCLEPDVLLANSCWELMVRWNKDPSVAADNSLTDSLEYLQYVSSAVLKHNIACLLWKTFVLKRFETLSNLMEKMGRTPKDRICMKELGIHENRIEAFVQYSQQLLDLILSSNMMAEMEPMPLFTVDDWWKGAPTVGQAVPLVIMAVHQKTANGALVLEHSRLATVIQFIVSFQLKSSKPLTLFADVVKQYLFKEMHTFPVVASNADPSLTEKRLKFLFNVISGIVQTLPVHNENESDYFVNQSKHYSEANIQFGKLITLSREWDLNLDQIRRKYVYELYFHGCDPLAEEALTSVIDIQALGAELLPIGGLRALDAIHRKYGSVEQMHTLSTNCMFWLKSLEANSGHYSGCPSSATLALLQHINNYVFADKTNARICETLIETIKIIDNNL